MGGMMSLKVLHAGDGYAYLTRQVATADNPRKRGELMADYYTAHGVPAGQWWGKGAEILGVSGEVTEEQMRASYGEFLHPDAAQTIREHMRNGDSAEDAVAKVRLGRRPLNFNNEIPFVVEVDARIATFTTHNQRVPNREEREHIEQTVAKELYFREHDVVPDHEQMIEFICEQKRRQRFPVSGYDMVFTPAKSVSVLWGIGDEKTRKAITKAHQQAVEEALQWIEDKALFSREGAQGVRKVECAGATVARFVHWDNRAGDPNLHTHCALLNRVLCGDGKYRTVDGQVLHRAAVTASERYNNRVTDLVKFYTGVDFEPQQKSRGSQPVWEVKGIPKELVDGFSRRDGVLERGRKLIQEYRDKYHREPSKATQYRLMEQANLETRGAKDQPRSLKEMVSDWRQRADSMSKEFTRNSVLDEVFAAAQKRKLNTFTDAHREGVLRTVMDNVSRQRSTWTQFHIESEIYRQLAAFDFPNDSFRDNTVERLLDQALNRYSVRVERKQSIPDELCRANGESIYVSHGSTTYTSSDVLNAEKLVHKGAVTWRINNASHADYSDAVRDVERKNGYALSGDKRAMIEHLLFSPAEIAVATGAAGTGKTTAMETFSRAWEKTGGRVFGLAPSAKAASVLQESIGVTSTTLASLIHNREVRDGTLREGDVLLVDEAGMASTRDLCEVYELARERGAFVRMVGDPQQLASVDSGGLLKELAERTNAPTLTEVRRFTDKDEADVSLRLRAGDVSALEWYYDHDRVVTGLREELPGRVFESWIGAQQRGKTALMIAGDNATVKTLNVMARNHFIDQGTVIPASGEVSISDGNRASIGDVIVTRRNDPGVRFGYKRSQFVKNGDLWTVTGITDDGGLEVRHPDTDEVVSLSAQYAAESVELGYASTVYRSQGMTVDECYVMPSYSLDRQGFYVAMTRGRELNQVFVPDDSVPDVDSHIEQLQPPSALDVLTQIMARDGSQVTAHAAIDNAQAAFDFETVKLAYEDLTTTVARDYLLGMCGDDAIRELLENDWQTSRLTIPLAQLSHTSPSDMEWTVRTALAEAKDEYDSRDEDKRPSLAFLVRMKLEKHSAAVADPNGDNLLWTNGLALAPQWSFGLDDDLRDFMQHTADRLQEHLAQHGDSVLAEGADWADEHLPAPAKGQTLYAAARDKAVRVLAAAELHHGHDLTDFDSLDETLTTFVSRAHSRRKRGDRDIFDRMDSAQLRHYIGECVRGIRETETKIAGLSAQYDEQLLLPEHSAAQKDKEDYQNTAVTIRRVREISDALRTSQDKANGLGDELEKAKARNAFGRNASTIDSLDQAWRDARGDVNRLRAELDELTPGLPARAQWDEVCDLADNDAEWDQRIANALAADSEAIDTTERQISRLRSQLALWEEKKQVAEGFVSAGKVDPDVRAKLIGDLRRKLEANRAQRQQQQQQTAEHDPQRAENRSRVEQFRAQRAERLRQAGEGEAPSQSVKEVFSTVIRETTAQQAQPEPAPQPTPQHAQPEPAPQPEPNQAEPDTTDQGVDL